MHEPNAKLAQSTSTQPLDGSAADTCHAPRTRALAALFWMGLVASLGACQGAAEENPAPEGAEALGTTEQDLSVSDLFPLIRPTISRVLTLGVGSARGIADVLDGAPALALASVRTCRDEVVTCVDDAVGDLAIGSCADGLDVCVDSVVDIIDPLLDRVDPILDPLPGPNVGELVDGTAACRSDAKDCLVAALNLNDIRACGDVLGTCVDDVAAIADQTVGDIDALVPLPVAVPKPSDVIDCSLQLTQCLAGLNNPFDCADQARACATP